MTHRLGVLVLVACASPSFERCAIRCGAGGVCPAGSRCDPADGYCHDDGDLGVCLVDGTSNDGGGDGGLVTADGPADAKPDTSAACLSAPCPLGTCRAGICCDGCWGPDGACHPGDKPDRCGLGGVECARCSDFGGCACDSASCPSQIDVYFEPTCTDTGSCAMIPICCGPADSMCTGDAACLPPGGCL